AVPGFCRLAKGSRAEQSHVGATGVLETAASRRASIVATAGYGPPRCCSDIPGRPQEPRPAARIVVHVAGAGEPRGSDPLHAPTGGIPGLASQVLAAERNH